jgi:fucose permease
MSTSAIAFFISNQVSIARHITTLMICSWLYTQYCFSQLSITFPPRPDADDAYQLTSIKQFKFKINWLLSIGFFCLSILEFTIADWATLFGKEELGLDVSIATLSYLCYLVGLIIGRFSIV